MKNAGKMRAMLLVAPVLALTACGSNNPFKAITERPPAPDEFSVLARKPLQMPNSIALPEPRLGEQSALEPNPNRDAIVALLGTSAANRTQAASAGEQSLLNAANAAAEQTQIRQILEEETLAEVENKPYEAPSLFDLFSDDDDKLDPGELINPAAESRRLQTQGVAAAPIDPAALPPESETAATAPEEEIIFHPRRGILRKN